MEWGEQEEFLSGLAAETGKKPKALIDRPAIDEHLRFAWNAYWELASDRPHNPVGSPAAIPFAAIDRYAARYGVDDMDEFARFHQLVRRMDMAFRAHMSKKNATESDGGEGQIPGG